VPTHNYNSSNELASNSSGSYTYAQLTQSMDNYIERHENTSGSVAAATLATSASALDLSLSPAASGRYYRS
jgi:K+-transporting ATPase c subunit